MPPLEERVEYPFQNIRTKNFPWGDGDKTLLYVCLHPFFPSELYNVPRLERKKREKENGDVLTESDRNSWNDSVNYHNKDKTT